MQVSRRTASTSFLVALALITLPACSLTIGAERISARASVFAGMNRETRQDLEAAELEGKILIGLIAEDGGKTDLARAFLQAKGYSTEQVEQRIALVRAKAALAAAGK